MGDINGNNSTNGAHEDRIECDVVVVGAGFSGISAVYRLRKLGFKVQGFEAGSNFGGVWYWNRYPGARVDSETPYYQLSIPEVYNTWNFSCRFPDHKELRKYCEHIDKTLNLSKEYKFNAKVNSCEFNAKHGKWTVKTEAGHVAVCKYLLLATGLLHKRHSPEWPGLKDYKGTVEHTSFWPEDVNVRGKKVAVIGAGATSVQVVQEVAKEADELTMFMRRPSYCFPMKQRKVSEEEQEGWKAFYERLFQQGRLSAAGFPYTRPGKKVFDVTDEEREAHFEKTWNRGAFNFTICGYDDVVLDRKANRVVYDFWAKKVRARMTDPVKQELMAPTKPPYHFSTKRSPLENDYYECLDMKHVDIVNLNNTPIKNFTETGIVTGDGVSRDFDIVILATGFDSFTGS
jgi:cation diffusion facilitator CzcD-associated flavoprotein CzcO